MAEARSIPRTWMSAPGRNLKCSARPDFFRFTPAADSTADITDGPLQARNGLLLQFGYIEMTAPLFAPSSQMMLLGLRSVRSPDAVLDPDPVRLSKRRLYIARCGPLARRCEYAPG
jgi:hypothetical protein